MSNNFDKTRAALVTAFRTGWPLATDTTTTPTGLPLAKIEMPNKKNDRGVSNPFGRLTVNFSGRENAAIGGLKIRLRGFLYLQIFVPEGTGTKTLTDSADHFAAIMDNKNISFTDNSGNVICSAVDSVATGARDGYEQSTLALPFYSDANT